MKYYISGGGAQRKTTERGARNKNLLKLTNYVTDFCLPQCGVVCRGAVRCAHKIQRANNNCWQFTQSGCPLLLGLWMLLPWLRLWLEAFGRVLELALNKCPKALENALNAALHSSHSSSTAALRTPYSTLQSPSERLNFVASTNNDGFLFRVGGWFEVGMEVSAPPTRGDCLRVLAHFQLLYRREAMRSALELHLSQLA